MSNKYDPNLTWLGVGVKGGGIIFFAGTEGVEGNIWHMTTPARNWFSVSSFRFGVGLGGSVGLVAICVFNCDNAKVRLDKTELKDWGINVAMEGKWSAVAKGLKDANFWLRIGKLGLKGTKALQEAGKLREDLHLIYTGLDIETMGSGPKVVVIDSPVGVGLELSINYSIGKIEIN